MGLFASSRVRSDGRSSVRRGARRGVTCGHTHFGQVHPCGYSPLVWVWIALVTARATAFRLAKEMTSYGKNRRGSAHRTPGDWGVDTIFGLPGDGIKRRHGGTASPSGQNPLCSRAARRGRRIHGMWVCQGHRKTLGCASQPQDRSIHLLNGLYDAKLDHQPVLAITGMQETQMLERAISRRSRSKSCTWTSLSITR